MVCFPDLAISVLQRMVVPIFSNLRVGIFASHPGTLGSKKIVLADLVKTRGIHTSIADILRYGQMVVLVGM